MRQARRWIAAPERWFAAGFLLIIGLGRLGLWSTSASADLLSKSTYGWLLVIAGVAIILTTPRRFDWPGPGRPAAAFGAVVMMTMAWDIGVLGVTALTEGWIALFLAVEALRSHDC